MQRTAVLLLASLLCVFAHSWLDCVDFRFNTPTYKGWSNTDGTCMGYPRSFNHYNEPNFVYGSEGERTYVQDPNRVNPDAAAPCHPVDWADERRKNPISLSYAPNQRFGPMAVVTAGQQLCFRWPAKNHNLDNGQMVQVHWATQPNVDPTQVELKTMRVAQLYFKNCSQGIPSADDQCRPVGSCTPVPGAANAPCGGCFTVPNRAPGNYLVQWRWELNAGEVYTSCADVQVAAPNNVPTSAPTRAATSAPTSAPTRAAATSATRAATAPTTANSGTRPATSASNPTSAPTAPTSAGVPSSGSTKVTSAASGESDSGDGVNSAAALAAAWSLLALLVC